MLPYWLLFSMFAAGSFQLQERRTRGTTPIFLLAAFVVALMVGLRFRVGGDWANYLVIFDYIAFMSLDEALLFSDPGYAALNWAANTLGIEIWSVNLVCAFIFTWGLSRFAMDQPNPWLACLVAVPYLIIVVGMGYTRQAVAIGLMMPALIAFKNHKIGRSLLLFAAAVLFHKTAVILLPLMLGAVTRNRILLWILLILTGFILYYAFLGSSVDRLMTNYVEADYDSGGAAVRISMNLVPAILFFCFQHRFGFDDVERKIWRNFSLAAFASVAALMLVASSTAVDRMALYIVPLQLVILSRLPYLSGIDGGLRVMLLGAVIAYSAAVQFVWLNYATHATLWLPYQLYPWDGDDRLRF